MFYFPNKVKHKNFRINEYFLAHKQHKIQTQCGNLFHNLLYRPPFYEHCLTKIVFVNCSSSDEIKEYFFLGMNTSS